MGGKRGDLRIPDEEGFWKSWTAAIKRGRGAPHGWRRWDEMRGGWVKGDDDALGRMDASDVDGMMSGRVVDLSARLRGPASGRYPR